MMQKNITENITFYSYKGGVGRSLALVNIAFHLTKLGKSVLIWELDLEAPGLLRIPIFESLAADAKGGMVDLLVDPEPRLDAIRSSLKKWVLPFQDETHQSFKLHIFPAGVVGDSYAQRYSQVDWGKFFDPGTKFGFHYFDAVQQALTEEFEPDYILIDSRTGLTDLAGISTAALADTVVLVFNLSHQGIDGIESIKRALEARGAELRKTPIRILLLASPVPVSDPALRQRRLDDLKQRNLIPDAQIELQERLLLSEVIVSRDAPEDPNSQAFAQIAAQIINRPPATRTTMDVPAQSPYVFLSYKREDLPRVEKLRAALEAAGIAVWWDNHTAPGVNWRHEIRRKLEDAHCVIVCWSRLSVTADWVREEATVAKRRYTLLPILLDAAIDPPFGFGEVQALDLSSWPGSGAAFTRLVEAARQKLQPRPTIFISSTVEDLIPYREQVHAAAHALGFAIVLSDGATATPETAQAAIAQADIFLLIVAHRHGPLTALEYNRALKLSKPIAVFLIDPAHPWPAELKEEHRTREALDSPNPAQVIAEVKRNLAALAEFKSQLAQAQPPPILFTDPFSLRAATVQLLQDWLERHTHNPLPGAADHELYLKYLEDDTRQIRIRGLKSKRAEPYFFGIDEIYIPLTTLTAATDRQAATEERTGLDRPHRRTALEDAISQRKLVVIGEPGAGKSTFLRRVAFELCRTIRNTRPAEAAPFLAPDDRRFPLLIRIGDLAKLLTGDSKNAKPDRSPDWIPYFLAQQSQEFKWGLSYKFFESKLTAPGDGGCLILIDGLDEAPDRRTRERIARIFEQATRTFHHCDFLVTTRPLSYEGDAILAGFHPLRIGALETPEKLTFLHHFARALALSPAESEKFHRELGDAIEHRFEIREMAANPVMLTALAVLQHNDQRLPEHRVQLYESVLNWLAAAREHKDGRPDAKRCLETMRRLALHMQDAPQGRLVQINRRTAAEFLAAEFGSADIEEQESLLERETEDSGIISAIGADLKFWHLSFQEYLAAREISSLPDHKQIERVVATGKLYRPEWRETMRLLGAVLRLQGEEKIEGLVKAILSTLGKNPALPAQAPCVALLGAMMRDLEPMDYQPKTPDYQRTVKAVMSIFERDGHPGLSLQTRIEAADALGQVGDPRLEENNWVVIPAGSFWMGAQKDTRQERNYDAQADPSRESPVHEVALRAFRLRRFPVTVQEYAAFIQDNGYSNRKHWSAGGFGQFTEPENWERQQQYRSRPVVGVCWFEAAAYCAWASCRLPSEAEWERAARGPQSGAYPWGNRPPLDAAHANYGGEPGYPTPVGLYPLGNSPEGLSDLLGNVWEWTADWFDENYYANSPQADPKGPAEGKYRVLRGGSWDCSPGVVRVSYRLRLVSAVRSNDFGFRCGGEYP